MPTSAWACECVVCPRRFTRMGVWVYECVQRCVQGVCRAVWGGAQPPLTCLGGWERHKAPWGWQPTWLFLTLKLLLRELFPFLHFCPSLSGSTPAPGTLVPLLLRAAAGGLRQGASQGPFCPQPGAVPGDPSGPSLPPTPALWDAVRPGPEKETSPIPAPCPVVQEAAWGCPGL